MVDEAWLATIAFTANGQGARLNGRKRTWMDRLAGLDVRDGHDRWDGQERRDGRVDESRISEFRRRGGWSPGRLGEPRRFVALLFRSRHPHERHDRPVRRDLRIGDSGELLK